MEASAQIRADLFARLAEELAVAVVFIVCVVRFCAALFKSLCQPEQDPYARQAVLLTPAEPFKAVAPATACEMVEEQGAHFIRMDRAPCLLP